MNGVTIEVASIESAKPGKKMGKLMTTGAEPYLVWPNDLTKFQIGGHYEIEFEENEFQGRVYRKIKKMQPVTATASASKPVAKPVSNGNGKAMPSPSEEERAFIRDLLAVGLRTGAVAFAAHDLRTAIAMLRTIYRELA